MVKKKYESNYTDPQKMLNLIGEFLFEPCCFDCFEDNDDFMLIIKVLTNAI